MHQLLLKLIQRLNPDIQRANPLQQVGSVADVLTTLYALPLWLAGLFWLTWETDFELMRQNILIMLVIATLMFLLNRVSFYLVTEIRAGGYANSDGTLDGVVLWSGLFLFGPSVLWLEAFWAMVYFIRGMQRAATRTTRWNRLRSYLASQAGTQLGMLSAFTLYQRLGGSLPFPGLSFAILGSGLAALLLHFAVIWMVWGGYIAYIIWMMKIVLKIERGRPLLRFMLLTLGFPSLANPFALVGADLYTSRGLPLYLFFMSGILLAALLARRLSLAAENARQSSRQLSALESLSQALLKAPPDGSTLPALLQEYVPTMFPTLRSLVWTIPERILCHQPEEWQPETRLLSDWIAHQQQPMAFISNEKLPWQDEPTSHAALLVAPVLDTESGQAIGGVYFELQSLAMPWRRDSLARLVPAVQSLAAQIASVKQQAHTYQRALTNQKTLEQLELARRIQASFLPEALPQAVGWDFAALLEPARLVAGDFYDFIDLPENKLGLLIADVADKGLGSALYMALSRTLIRTFAIQYVVEPEIVLAAANARILQDARANLFVTVFYGVLDLDNGELTYCNAGHTPPMRLKAKPNTMQMLGNTGMPLGIEPQPMLRRAVVQLDPGDMLFLHTDGITDAQNDQGEFIDRQHLYDLIQALHGQAAQTVQQGVLNEIHRFSGPAAQFDDITMMILVRK